MPATQWLENSSRRKQLPTSVLNGTSAPITSEPIKSVEPQPWKASWTQPAPADRQRKIVPNKPTERPAPHPVIVTPSTASDVKGDLREQAIRMAHENYIKQDHSPKCEFDPALTGKVPNSWRDC